MTWFYNSCFGAIICKWFQVWFLIDLSYCDMIKQCIWANQRLVGIHKDVAHKEHVKRSWIQMILVIKYMLRVSLHTTVPLIDLNNVFNVWWFNRTLSIYGMEMSPGAHWTNAQTIHHLFRNITCFLILFKKHSF